MKLEPVNYQDPHAPEQFVACLREYGFGVLTQHPLAQTQIESIYQNWLAFFKTEDKYQYRFKKGCMDGYFPPDVSETAKGYDIKDIKEYFHFYHPWGCCPDSLRDELLAYRDAANQVAET